MAPVSDEVDVKELNLTLDLCLRIGEMLLSNGAGAADVTATMAAVAHHLGMRATDIDVTFTSISIGYQYDPAAPSLQMTRSVTQRSIDYEDVTQVDQLVRDLLRGEVDLYMARNRMAVMASTPHPFPRWAVTVATGVSCAAVAMFLGGSWPIILIAFTAAASIDRAQLALARRRLPNFYLQVVGGVIATLFALGAAASNLDVDPSLVVSANILVLLAGIGFMGALQDALSGFYVTSGARVLEALLATAGIIAGVSAGLSVGTMLGLEIGRLEPGRSGWQDLGVLVVGSAICAAAFAFSCYAPLRTLVAIAVIAGAGSAVYRGVMEAELGRTWASASAAFLIGLVAYAAGKFTRVPPLVIVVPAIVPLLPGLTIYRGLSLLAEGGSGTSVGLLSMMTAASVAIALSSGVILGEFVAQPVAREARKLEQRLAGPRLVGVFRARSKR